MNVWGITDRGKIREQNQDAFAHQVLPDGRVIALVCDGMGGARAGNIASSMAVDVFMEAFLEDGEDSPDLEHMERAAALANRQVFRRAVEDENCVGMGTTLVGAILQGNTLWVVNVGDSRAYHITQNAIQRITRDHSVVEDLVAKGDLTPEQARRHPQKNLITRALGTSRKVKADLFQKTVAEGDWLLLCSDGLINEVTDQEIHQEVLAGGTPQEICQRLVIRTLDSGAPDNVTVVLFHL